MKLPYRLKRIAGTLWSKTPSYVRHKIVRSTQSKFTVSVAALITNENGEVLLLRHTLRPKYDWGFPGGFINSGEQPSEALQREMSEEIGIELKNIKMIRIRTANRHIEIIFRAEAVGEPQLKSREIIELGWFNLDNTPEKLHPVQRKFIKEILESHF